MGSKSFQCFDLAKAVQSIAAATGVAEHQVQTAVELLEDGNTLPFIARYRKEATGGLDETALRLIEAALRLFRARLESANRSKSRGR